MQFGFPGALGIADVVLIGSLTSLVEFVSATDNTLKEYCVLGDNPRTTKLFSLILSGTVFHSWELVEYITV